MDRTTKTLIAVFTLVAAVLLATNHAVNEVALQDWWLAGLLFVVSLAFWAWLWQEGDDDVTGAIVVAGDGSSETGMQEWIISKEMVPGVPQPPEIDEDAVLAAQEPADEPDVIVTGKPDLASDERAEVTDAVVEALPDDAEIVEEAKNGEPAAEQEVAEAMAASPVGKLHTGDTKELDDLERIEGIGPKYSDALIAAGVTSFARIAAMTVDDFTAIAQEAGLRRAASMETWAEQAKFAAAGDWDGLDAFQQSLTGGRREDE